jgi:hypothetical protein
MSEENNQNNSGEEAGYMMENKISSDDVKIKKFDGKIEEGTIMDKKINSNKSNKSDKEIDSNILQGLEYNHQSSK